MYEADGPGRRLEFLQRHRERAGPELGGDLVRQDAGDPRPCNRRVDGGFGRVDDQTRMDRDGCERPDPKDQLSADISPSKVMQSWPASSPGTFGMPRPAK